MAKADADSVEDANELRRRNGVQSINRAVAILRCFNGRRPELGISELARSTGLSTSTVHRLLGAMQQNHLVRQTAAKRYGLGPFVLQLANSGAMPRTFREAALPFMTDLRNEFDETVGLHELVGGVHRIVTAQVESHQELRRTYTDIGVPIKLVHGAPGKAIMSAMSAADCEACLAGPIEPITTSTPVDPETIRRELEIARACGYSRSRGQRTVGICAVATPIFDHTQQVVGAIGVSVPDVRMPEERLDQIGTRVREVGWQLSMALGASAEGVRAQLPDFRVG